MQVSDAVTVTRSDVISREDAATKIIRFKNAELDGSDAKVVDEYLRLARTSRRVSQTGLLQALKRGKFSVEQVEEFGTKYFVVPRNSLTSTLPPKVAEFLMTPEELVAKHNMDTCELSLDAVFVF